MKTTKISNKLNIIGENIKAARIKQGLSQNKLSDKLQLIPVYICRGSISRIEHGERSVTDIEIVAIARVLKTTPNQLFNWQEQ